MWARVKNKILGRSHEHVEGDICCCQTTLGELLQKLAVLTDEELAFALLEQTRTREKLGQVLLRLGFVQQEDLERALELQGQLRSSRPESACLSLLRAQLDVMARGNAQTAALLLSTGAAVKGSLC